MTSWHMRPVAFWQTAYIPICIFRWSVSEFNLHNESIFISWNAQLWMNIFLWHLDSALLSASVLTVVFLHISKLRCFILAGKKALPDAKLVVEKFLLRKKFIPDPQGSSLMFGFFAQHFTHQFFKSDMKNGPAFTKALGHGVSPHNLHYNCPSNCKIKIKSYCFLILWSGGFKSHLWRYTGKAAQT